jgi:multidrug transporter EmrE-like cation transporter
VSLAEVTTDDAFDAYSGFAADSYPATMVVRLALALGASAFFVTGSMLMKPAAGLTRLWPSVAVFAAFGAGLVLDILLVRAGDEVGTAFFLVIGLESTMVAILTRWLYHEPLTAGRVAAMALVVTGIMMLAAAEPAAERQSTVRESSTPIQPLP